MSIQTFSAQVKLGERLVRNSDAVGLIKAFAEVERIATELSQALTCVIKPTQGKES